MKKCKEANISPTIHLYKLNYKIKYRTLKDKYNSDLHGTNYWASCPCQNKTKVLQLSKNDPKFF